MCAHCTSKTHFSTRSFLCYSILSTRDAWQGAVVSDILHYRSVFSLSSSQTFLNGSAVDFLCLSFSKMQGIRFSITSIPVKGQDLIVSFWPAPRRKSSRGETASWRLRSDSCSSHFTAFPLLHFHINGCPYKWIKFNHWLKPPK